MDKCRSVPHYPEPNSCFRWKTTKTKQNKTHTHRRRKRRRQKTNETNHSTAKVQPETLPSTNCHPEKNRAERKGTRSARGGGTGGRGTGGKSGGGKGYPCLPMSQLTSAAFRRANASRSGSPASPASPKDVAARDSSPFIAAVPSLIAASLRGTCVVRISGMNIIRYE